MWSSDVDIGEHGLAVHDVVADATVTTQKKSLTGFNVGVDATYILWRTTAFASAPAGSCASRRPTVDIQMLTTAQPTDVGGVQFGFGARLRF